MHLLTDGHAESPKGRSGTLRNHLRSSGERGGGGGTQAKGESWGVDGRDSGDSGEERWEGGEGMGRETEPLQQRTSFELKGMASSMTMQGCLLSNHASDISLRKTSHIIQMTQDKAAQCLCRPVT